MESSLHFSKFPKDKLTSSKKLLDAYAKEILVFKESAHYSRPESALFIAGDIAYQSNIKKALRNFKKPQHVVLIGIGGSSLGTEAVYSALSKKGSPSLLTLDCLDTDALQRFETILKSTKNVQDIAVVVITKSGTTTETMMNAIKAIEVGVKYFGDKFEKRVIFVGSKDSTFYNVGKERGILTFSFPEMVKGRYSVFSAVGIVPLTLLGIDVTQLCRGANSFMNSQTMKQTNSYATTLAAHAEEGVHTVNFFTFNKKLILCGNWYRQLLAESIGKNVTLSGKVFTHQLLPIVSSAVDLHSMAQLYLGGYKNIYTHFVWCDENNSLRLLKSSWLFQHVPFLRGKKFHDALYAIKEGVIKAYADQKLSYRYSEIKKCNEYEIGFMFSSLMYEVMCLGKVLDVDPFNQPSVELYKKHTRKVLGS
ncbi:MAG: hypothetical protein K9M10_01370 [Candidatus Pacebacteria bacterium]|nr:hypothetical protein [Candidatus Paceibacterota bacterium]MCF7857113.1 hypothetical protein [Candidatus Paceibacterota bacterium]